MNRSATIGKLTAALLEARHRDRSAPEIAAELYDKGYRLAEGGLVIARSDCAALVSIGQAVEDLMRDE